MKKYVLGILVAFALLSSPARAAEPIFGFLDGKFYDSTATLRYQCFMDGNCYDLEGKPAPFKIVPIAFTQPVAPIDLCANIEGVQSSIPVGLMNQNGNCITTSSSANTSVDVAKANQVKALLNAYITGLDSQIDSLNNSPLYEGIVYKDNPSIYELPYDIFSLETHPTARRLMVKDTFTIKSYPTNFSNASRKVVDDTKAQTTKLQNDKNRAAAIITEISDYLSTGLMPPAEERAYLQSIGIAW